MRIIQHKSQYKGQLEKINNLPHVQGGDGHAGSWFGLPDFGLTELFSPGRTSQGGSNLFGSGTALLPTGSGGWQPVNQSADVLGISDTPISNTPNMIPSVANNPSQNTSSGGAGDSQLQQLAKTDRNPAQEAEYQRLLSELGASQNNINQQIDNAFNAKMGYLNQAEGTLRDQFPGIQNEINQNFANTRSALDTQKTASLRDIDTAQTGGEQRQEDALTAARRLYNELVMGGQQRFGGASTAGEAYQALAGRELQRNNASIQKDFSNFMGQITNARTSLNEQYTQAVTNIETQKNSALTNARREFDNKMLEISRMKAEAEGDKANARLSALQDLRNQIFQINLVTAQMRSQVDQQAQASATQLDQAISTFQQQAMGASGATDTLGQSLNMNPQTSLSTNYASPSGELSYIGSINPDEENQMFTGAIAPRRRETFSFA